jgi:hypothetical protein
MAINKRQHFVSQFTIRAFMGDRDRLFCLDKSTLQVRDRTHGNLPADILNEAYYYTTDTDDFDGEIVRPLETKLAPICSRYVADPDRPLTLDDMAVLVDWCALSLTRSIYFAHVAPIAYESLSPEDKADLPADGKAMTLVARRATFHRIRQEMRKVGLTFRFLKSPRPFGYYLTDQPAAPIPYRRVGAIGPLLLPLAHNLILVQIPTELADEFYRSLTPTLEWLTLAQCGWARRLIYSADLEALDFAAFVLSEGSGDWPKEMRERARRPFFGFGEPSELASMWADETPQ